MEDDLDLRRFENRCRLFPLRDLVFFPHNVLPLHVFEPRYRQMTEDALASDQLVTMVRLKDPATSGLDSLGSPPIDTVGCLGRILQPERTADGRYYFLLVGRKRVRLIREIPSDKLYRIAEAEVLEDEGPSAETAEASRSELTRLFRAVVERGGPLDPDLARLLDSAVPLGMLTDIVANALPLPPELKQTLLAERDVTRRAETLLQILRHHRDSRPGPVTRGRTFPPPFSSN